MTRRNMNVVGCSDDRKPAVQEILRSFSKVKVEVPHHKNTLTFIITLILHTSCYLNKSISVLLAKCIILKTKST